MAVRLTIRPSEHGFARLTPAVLFKVKVNRWRGAVHESADPSWLAAVGLREDGSQDDCYKAFANAARARHSVEHRNALSSDIFCCGWLPDDDDHDRYRVEAGIRLLGELRSTVHRLVCSSLLDGREHAAELAGAVSLRINRSMC